MSDKGERDKRLAAALRENLKRRKDGARGLAEKSEHDRDGEEDHAERDKR